MEINSRLLAIVLLLISSASAKSEEKYPTGNVNLSPFRGWRSAYECLLFDGADYAHQLDDGAVPCAAENKLSMKGEIVVAAEDTHEFCKAGGCGEHIRTVLNCIRHVKRDFWFANRAPVQFLQDAIAAGCSNFTEIDTTEYLSSFGMKNYQSFPKSLLMLALPTILFMAPFVV